MELVGDIKLGDVVVSKEQVIQEFKEIMEKWRINSVQLSWAVFPSSSINIFPVIV